MGAGDGYLARRLLDDLPAASQMVCLDPNYSDTDLVRLGHSGGEGLRFAREVPEEKFDVLLMLDVIEHVPDDQAFVGNLVGRNLAPGGLVLVSVPAWQGLFSAHDTALKHYRRYTLRGILDVLEAEGLTILRSGGLFHSLLLPRLWTVAREALVRRLGREPAPPANLGAWRGSRLVSALLERALAFDNAVTHAVTRYGRQLPGLSVWALCRAPVDWSPR